MQGKLFKYGPSQPHTAFMTGQFNRHVILVGGLGDGLMFAPYCEPLATELNSLGWALVQTLLSSSYSSYGVEGIDKDADEINMLATHLGQAHNSQGFVVMGHSTGCQDIVQFAKKYGQSQEGPPLLGYILQAPVSDREAQQSSKSDAWRRERLDAAQLMSTNGEGEEILFRDWDMRGAPICGRRFLALSAYEGDDDLFSTDFSDDQLKEKLKHMGGTPSLLLMGGADEFFHGVVDQLTQVNRLAAAIGKPARAFVVPEGKHNLTGSEEHLVRLVADFLNDL